MTAKRRGRGHYAPIFLWCCDKEAKSDDEIDISVFKRLSELDTKLGITASQQLFDCLRFTTRWDIIKV